MKNETTKKDLVLDIESKFTLIGDRVLILLDEAQGHTVTESGITIPLNELVATDSGRMSTETSAQKHLASGTIISVGTTASQKLTDANISLAALDRVYVAPSALSKGYYFFPDRTKLVQDFNGYVCIPHTLIEAKINNGI